MKCEQKDVREGDFIDILLSGMIRFTLPFARRLPKIEDTTQNQNEINKFYQKRMAAITKEAKNLLMDKLTKNLSEFGELFLFMIMEAEGYTQLLNKMNLKTNGEMPVHGLDAIHINVKTPNIIRNYGYSKVYENFTGDIYDVCGEITEFINCRKRQDREFQLVSSYLDEGKFTEYSQPIKDLLEPYSPNKKYLGSAHCIFLGYEWDFLQTLDYANIENLEDYLTDEYKKTHEKLEENILNHIKKIEDFTKYSFYVWVLPFKNIIKFREKFIEMLKEY
jgi:ribosomal protein S18